MRKVVLLLFMLIGLSAWAQNKTDSAGKGYALKVFLDCNYCDMDYLRTELTFIDYVRDRMEATNGYPSFWPLRKKVNPLIFMVKKSLAKAGSIVEEPGRYIPPPLIYWLAARFPV